jgi:hypothetical protein
MSRAEFFKEVAALPRTGGSVSKLSISFASHMTSQTNEPECVPLTNRFRIVSKLLVRPDLPVLQECHVDDYPSSMAVIWGHIKKNNDLVTYYWAQ